jgi:hypothetical protein
MDRYVARNENLKLLSGRKGKSADGHDVNISLSR